MSKEIRILLISYYFPPDFSAGSFRAKALADALMKQTKKEVLLDIVTTQPHRYGNSERPVGNEGGVTEVTRFPVGQNPLNFFRFAFAVLKHTKTKDYDVVIATSSRLMSAVLGAAVASRKRAKLVLDIRDNFLETIADLRRASPVRLAFPIFRVLEKWALRKADLINLVSPAFLPYFRKKYAGSEFTTLTNGIDDEFIQARATPASVKDPELRIIYAGNIGEGQGLEKIVPALARQLQGTATFTLVGDGSGLDELRKKLSADDSKNVTLLAPVDRRQLIDLYTQADILFLHLNTHRAFENVLPSKIFEYAASGKPILAGVSGYARKFLEENVENSAVFVPGDIDGAVLAFNKLEKATISRSAFVKKYARTAIMNTFAAKILETAD